MDNIIDFGKPETQKEPECSFCKRSKREVKKLIGGETGPYICYECVARCNKLLAEHA